MCVVLPGVLPLAGFGGVDCSSCLPGFVRLNSSGACFKTPHVSPYTTNSTNTSTIHNMTFATAANSTSDSSNSNSTGTVNLQRHQALATNSTSDSSSTNGTSMVYPQRYQAVAPESSHRQLISGLTDANPEPHTLLSSTTQQGTPQQQATLQSTPPQSTPGVIPQNQGMRNSTGVAASSSPGVGSLSSLAGHHRRELTTRECIMVCCVASAAAFLGLSLVLLRHYRRRILRLSGNAVQCLMSCTMTPALLLTCAPILW